MWRFNYRGLFDILDTAVLERCEDGMFRLMNDLPEWFPASIHGETASKKRLNPTDIFPFLENFLVDAQWFWSENRPDIKIYRSTPWLESDGEKPGFYLEASAVKLDHCDVLLITRLGRSYDETLKVVKSARDKMLELDRFIDSSKHLDANTDKTGRRLKEIIRDVITGRT